MYLWEYVTNAAQTLVVGPNAKVAVYHGGGSASLTAYYAVTPFDGISHKLSTLPEFALGCYGHKLLPALDQLYMPDGEPGLRMRVFNEPPTDSSRAAIDEMTLKDGKMMLSGYKNEKITSPLWYGDIEGTFTAEEDGAYDFGLLVVGQAKLFVNGDLIIDNATEQRQGDLFFGASTVEERGRVQLAKGQKYDIKIEFSTAVSSKLKSDMVDLGYGGFRLGGIAVTDTHAEIQRAVELAKNADQVVICAGLNSAWESEGFDRDHMGLPETMDDMIAAVSAANSNTVVVMQSGAPVTMPWINSVSGLVQAWYGGNETGNAIADVLFGDVNPSAKCPLCFPISNKHNPAYLNFRTEFGRTIYGEDVYVGYRYYEMVDRAVLFPFGHGLSYTNFEFSHLKVRNDGQRVNVAVTVSNTGSVKGKEVVQVYVAPAFEPAVKRPVKELKAFKKVEVAPGAMEPVDLSFELKYGASFFDEARKKWCVEKGKYHVIVGNSSATNHSTLTGNFHVDATFFWGGL